MLGAIVALALVLVPGLSVTQNGAQSWLAIGPIVGQPSEFAKLAVLIYMSAWLAAKGKAVVQDFTMGVLPFIGMVGLVIGLILVQPDLGTAVMIAIITGALFWVAGARLVHVMTLAGTTAAVAAVLVVSAGYRMDRIFAFTSAESDPMGVGFHTLQLLVAFGSGGLTGLGLGVSRQKFFYVFGAHTDGVLAIMGEELGFVGVMVVLALFALLLWRGIVIAKRAPDAFGSLLATGIVAWIGFQMLMNVGGVTRLIPLTGIPLPLVSYGGSALAATLIAIGLLLSISRYSVFKKPVPETPQRGAVATRPLARDHAPAAGGGAR
jgi:cell division protein FtsW